jgi:hypothetical protein
MKYVAKSLIIGRKKRKEGQEHSPCFIALFNTNKPHREGKVPDKILDFDEVRKVDVKGLDFEYQLEGSDIIIQDLTELSIDDKNEGDCKVISIRGKQNSVK